MKNGLLIQCRIGFRVLFGAVPTVRACCFPWWASCTSATRSLLSIHGTRANAVQYVGKPGWSLTRAPCDLLRCGRRVVSLQADMLGLLASQGAKLDIQTQTGATIAHIAARYGGADCLRVLCERGVDVTAVNHAGNTPVIFATVANDVEVGWTS